MRTREEMRETDNITIVLKKSIFRSFATIVEADFNARHIGRKKISVKKKECYKKPILKDGIVYSRDLFTTIMKFKVKAFASDTTEIGTRDKIIIDIKLDRDIYVKGFVFNDELCDNTNTLYLMDNVFGESDERTPYSVLKDTLVNRFNKVADEYARHAK